MAADAASWVWSHSRAANGSLIVLLAIADECGKEGHAEMTVAELARKSRLSERAVQNAVRDLAALGELSVTPGCGRGRRNSYCPYASKGAESAPLPAGNPAESAPFTETPQNLHPAESAPFTGHPPRPGRKGAESATFETSDVFNRSTGIQTAEVKEVPAKPPRADVERLCARLADRIEANGSKRPAVTRKWRDSCRLMLDKDGRTEEQISAAIDWCQDHEFWRANILSMPKLREQYDRLRLDAMRKPNGGHSKTTTSDRVRQAVEAGKRVQQMMNGGS